MRDAFPSDSESKLIEREKRAHCYDPKLLDQVLLSTPPLPCHKSCLAGVRALLRLYNSAAIGGPGEPRLGSGANFHVTFASPTYGTEGVTLTAPATRTLCVGADEGNNSDSDSEHDRWRAAHGVLALPHSADPSTSRAMRRFPSSTVLPRPESSPSGAGHGSTLVTRATLPPLSSLPGEEVWDPVVVSAAQFLTVPDPSSGVTPSMKRLCVNLKRKGEPLFPLRCFRYNVVS